MSVVKETDGLAVCPDEPHREPHPIRDEQGGQNCDAGCLRRICQKQRHHGGAEVEHPQEHVENDPPCCQIAAVEQNNECRTEEPVCKEVGRDVQQDGSCMVQETYTDKKMNDVIACENKKSKPHNPARTDVHCEYRLVRNLCHQEIDGKEKQQREGRDKRIIIHLHHR